MEEKETGKEKGSCEDRAALLRAPGEMAKVHQDPMFSDDVSFIEPMVNLINQGALDAPFSYIPSATKVGLGFKLAPQEGIIAAGGSQTLQISFSATVLGRFEEEFRFSLAGSPTPAILTIKGSVTGPSLHFDLPELDFGDISFGECCLGWDTAGGICAFQGKSIPPSCSAPAASSGWELQGCWCCREHLAIVRSNRSKA
ncbi:uncharacterized protein LOC135308436 isoform X1 [Passer domesticus]|uniref:uncharacterized protein LOC135308436 isoform X1 n=1 Tax=Passer domesticus TaxID=48849 RepID=UPI0030FEAAA1